MRITFVTPEYVTENYFSGGLANYVYRVSKALTSLGHEVHVITLSDIDRAEFDHDGIRVYRLTVGRFQQWLNRLTRHRLPGTSRWLDFSFKAYRKLRQLHKQNPFDIVQFPNSRACGLVASLLLRVPYVVRISCYRPVWRELNESARNLDARATEWLEWLQLRLSRHIYAPSYTLKRMLAEKAKIKNVRGIRTPIYLETVDWDQSVYNEHLKDKRYLLFFGRFQLHKGFHILAQALPQFLQAYPDSHAACVGLDTATRIAPSMKEYASSLCGENAVRLIFIGQTPHAQLYPIIAGARLVVLPSLIDNLPNTCLEAMALGKVVIGTRGASFEEVIEDGKTGFLVSPGRVEELAAKICQVWSRNDLEQIGKAAKEKASEFAPEYTVRALVDYYEDIING